MVGIKKFKFTNILSRFGQIHPRTQKAHLNTALGLTMKGGSMLISLLLVPLMIDYLDKDTYGVWLTISSMITMLTFLDIGVGNGLRNKFSEAVANNDTKLAQTYVSTSYVSFSAIQLLLIILFLISFKYIPWNVLFNTTINNSQLETIICIGVISMGLKLIFDLVLYVLFALQQPGVVNAITFVSNFFILISTYALTRLTQGNLTYLAIIVTVVPIITTGVWSIVLYNGKLRDYIPSIKQYNSKYLKSLFSLGYQFFILQIAVIVIFYTDNFIINQLFGPSEVTTYNVCFRYFNAINTLFAIAIAPYWSAFTEAYIKTDVIWMTRTYNFLIKMWRGLIVVVLIMVAFSDYVYSSWIGTRVHVPLTLSVFSGLFVIVSSWNGINSSILNGLGKIRLQLLVALFCSLINIPLAILFGKTLHMLSAGVIFATSVSLITASFVGGIQVRRLIRGGANGIWNR